jgi:hypothetical protein
MTKESGYNGRGRRAVSAQMPKAAMMMTVKKATGILRS